jgi:hypothetical protein
MPNRSTNGDSRESGSDKLLRVIYRLISELKINPKNPRTHSRRHRHRRFRAGWKRKQDFGQGDLEHRDSEDTGT